MVVLLPTKFYVPPAPMGFVARPQLLKKLDEALTHRLTLVSAPAGAGKTILVSHWVQSSHKKGAACGWLSLDEADNDWEHFLDYLVSCLEETGLEIEPAGLLHRRGEPVPVEAMAAALIRELASCQRPLILILDDYHLIQNSNIHLMLEYWITHAPPCLHLVLLTRSDPPFALARLRVAGQLLEIRMEDLRFSQQEAATFLNQAAGLHLPEDAVNALNQRTEGWIAGLQMAAISLRGRTDSAAFVSAFTASNRFVFDYLLEQVLNHQPEEIREFLLKTAVLEQLTAGLCDAVAETAKPARWMLNILEKENLFLIPLDDERNWYRYHHLFANLLQLLLEQTYPGAAADLHRRACRWYEAQDMLPEALRHALSSGDMQLVAQIVSANVLVLVENDQIAPTLQKIDAMPPEKWTALPWLGIARAWVLGAGQLEKSQQLLDTVEKSIADPQNRGDSQRLKGHLAAARACVLGAQGEMTRAIVQAQAAHELLPLDETAVRAMNLVIWGDMLVNSWNDPGAMILLEQAWTLALQARKPHVAMLAAGSLATAHLFAGRLHELQRVCLEALVVADEYQRRYQRSLSATADVYSLLARALAEWGENEKAIEYAQKGLKLSEDWGRVNTESTCLVYLARVLVFANDWEQARQLIQRAEQAARKISLRVWQDHAAFVLDTLLDRQTPDEGAIVQQVARLKESGAIFPPLLTARLILRGYQPGEARAVLEQALLDLETLHSFDVVRIHALRALAFQASGNEKGALSALRQALELAEPENRIASFVREGPAMEKLIRLAKTKAITPAFVQRVLAAFEARHGPMPKPASHSQALVEPLSERELEVLRHLNGYLSTPEIADLLVVSANTVRTHIKNIYGKLGVHGRSSAVRQARELGLLA